MTINEQVLKGIADVMKWGIGCHEYYILSFWDTTLECNQWMIVKAMQQRMVDDGWNVTVHQLSNTAIRELGKPFMAYAYKGDGTEVLTEWFKIEPQAIVELFCKVYDIKGAK